MSVGIDVRDSLIALNMSLNLLDQTSSFFMLSRGHSGSNIFATAAMLVDKLICEANE